MDKFEIFSNTLIWISVNNDSISITDKKSVADAESTESIPICMSNSMFILPRSVADKLNSNHFLLKAVTFLIAKDKMFLLKIPIICNKDIYSFIKRDKEMFLKAFEKCFRQFDSQIHNKVKIEIGKGEFIMTPI